MCFLHFFSFFSAYFFRSVIGISCIRDYNYYVSFGIMLCLPISILILASINYSCFKTSLKLRLLTMSEEEKIEEEEEALHSLFKLADKDNSGNVDSAELADILKALGWKVTIKSVVCCVLCHFIFCISSFSIRYFSFVLFFVFVVFFFVLT